MITELLATAKRRGLQDFFFAAGERAYGYADKSFVQFDDMPAQSDIMSFSNSVLQARGSSLWEQALKDNGCLAFLYAAPWGRVRITLTKVADRRGTSSRLSMSVRFLMDEAPVFADLDLPASILEWLRRRSGIILIVGITGDGKTTLETSLTRWFTETLEERAISIVDPLEYVATNPRWWQREVLHHTPSMARAVYDAMQMRPRLITVSEVKSQEVADAMFSASESGHLVIATAHADVPTDAPDRIAAMYGDSSRRHFAQYMLSQKLIGMVGVRLARVTDEYRERTSRGLRALCEVVPNTAAISNGIRTGSTRDLRGHVQSPAERNAGFLSFERHAADLGPSIVPHDEALRVVPDPRLYGEFARTRRS